MSLHVEQFGLGPDLVLLHGWGLHSGVFAHLSDALAARHRVTLIDLPGHGRSSAMRGDLTLPGIAEQIAAVSPPRAAWLGWSLGGMIATYIALAVPARVERLIWVASSPRFVTAEHWPHAMEPAVLTGFAQALEHDYRATLERFLSLQVTSGTAEGRETLRVLRALLLQQSPPDLTALHAGLAILQTADLRAQLPALACPLRIILGARDRLVPASVGAAVQQLIPTAHINVMTGAAHAPFLSHPREFLALLVEFLEHAHA